MKKLTTLILALTCTSLAHAGILPCNAGTGLRIVQSPLTPVFLVEQILKICDESSPDNMQVLLLHGLLARRTAKGNTDYHDAIMWLEKAANLATKADPTAVFELALTYEWSGELQKAKFQYNRLLGFTPNSLAGMLGLARVTNAQNNPTEAQTYYLKALMLDKNNIEALNALGTLSLDSKNITLAQGYFNRVLAINGSNAIALRGLQEISIYNGTEIKLSNFCEALFGERLLSLENPPVALIEKILATCDAQMPDNQEVLMLHGLLERRKSITTKNYQLAMQWFEKALDNSTTNKIDPALELAVTYEWAGDPAKAKSIYQDILKTNPSSRPAQLGYARVIVLEKKYDDANKIYTDLLSINPKDTAALNGLGRLEMARKNYQSAQIDFQKVLTIQPGNQDAIVSLEQIKKATIVKPTDKAKILCDANQGLTLLNRSKPPYDKINRIMKQCDKNAPLDVQTLLLHGMLARKQGEALHQYGPAIFWLSKAVLVAPRNNDNPLLELAVTYEWAYQPAKAYAIYQKILLNNPNSRPALLGLARVYRSRYELTQASAIYTKLLAKNHHDVDALNGTAMINLANYQVKQAKFTFKQVLAIQKNNTDALAGLELAKYVTPYLLSINQGKYTVSAESSGTTNVNFYAYLNATTQFLLQLTHNTNEIQLSQVLDPTILPKNSIFLGMQVQYPDRYGWGINYEYRERTQLRVEDRIGINANYYLYRNLQWFGGARQGFPSPWNNKLFFAGLNLLTKLPVDFAVTGYWGREQFGGSTEAYAFDLRKEFSNVAFYDAGASYSPTQLSWEIHGRVLLPLGKYQAIEGNYQHLYFNGASAYALGWQINC